MTRSLLLEKEAPPPAKNEAMIGLLACNRPVADSLQGCFLVSTGPRSPGSDKKEAGATEQLRTRDKGTRVQIHPRYALFETTELMMGKFSKEGEILLIFVGEFHILSRVFFSCQKAMTCTSMQIVS